MHDHKQPEIAGLLNTSSIDKQLRSRVKLFGHLLGNVLLSQAGAKVYDSVEKLRTGFISLRKEDNPVKRARLMNLARNGSKAEDTLMNWQRQLLLS